MAGENERRGYPQAIRPLTQLNHLPPIKLRMINLIKKPPPFRRQPRQHLLRKTRLMMPHIDMVVTEKQRHPRHLLLPRTRRMPHRLRKNQQRPRRTPIIVPNPRIPLVKKIELLAIIRLVAPRNKLRPPLPFSTSFNSQTTRVIPAWILPS
jgi:hypothetical protein